MRIDLVFGTSTEIGKTQAAMALCAGHQTDGLGVRLWKPFETGEDQNDYDSQSYQSFLNKKKEINKNVQIQAPVFSLQPAVSPHFALKDCIEAGKVAIPPVFGKDVVSWLKDEIQNVVIDAQESGTTDQWIVETAGGVMVEICLGWTNLQMGQFLLARQKVMLRPVLVASGGLGTINHSLLSIDCLNFHGLAPELVLFNRHDQATPKEAVMRNLNDVRRRRPGPSYGFLDYNSHTIEIVELAEERI